jgi:hypothetical protein
MGSIISLVILVVIIVWAYRVEMGLNKANESLKRIEDQLAAKKEKK